MNNMNTKKTKKITTDTYFLENNCELQVVLKTIPHQKIYIFNNNGKINISETSQIKKHTKLDN